MTRWLQTRCFKAIRLNILLCVEDKCVKIEFVLAVCRDLSILIMTGKLFQKKALQTENKRQENRNDRHIELSTKHVRH